jgi:hypothetical protein
LFSQTPNEDVVLDVMPRTFSRADTYISGASWKVFQCQHPNITFKQFWEFCYQYRSLHIYPLHFFMTMNVNSKVALVEPKTYKAPEVKEELCE